jgi:adenylosuccinate lyase
MKSLSSPFDAVSPLDFRYYGTDPSFMERYHGYVSEAGYLRYMAKVEAALAAALARRGLCTTRAAERIRSASEEVTPEEVWDEEQRTQHNVRALVNCIRNRLGDDEEARRVVHLFATSADIMDTANALRLKELCTGELLRDLGELMGRLISMAREHASTRQIGRTHGMFAEPITLGFALALYVERLGTRIEAILRAAKKLRGKMSGAVGAYNALCLAGDGDPFLFEKELMESLGLECPDSHISSQIVIPEPVQDLAHAAISGFTVLANLADDVRHLHRSEIGEVREVYAGSRVGSSTMPHKTNPKNFENVKSLWKAFVPRMTTVYLDGISEHQRDLTNSASSRFVIELFTAFAYATNRLTDALGKITVDRERMAENLRAAGASVLAEPLYVLLALQKRDPGAYDRVRELVRASEQHGRTLAEEVRATPAMMDFLRQLSEEQRSVIENPAGYIGGCEPRTRQICDFWEGRLPALPALA